MHPHILFPPHTSAQSFSQSFVGSSSQTPQLSSKELPLTTPLQSKPLSFPVTFSDSQLKIIKVNKNSDFDITCIWKINFII